MEKEINKDVLIVLKKRSDSLIIIDYVDIEYPLINTINKLVDLCEDENSTIEEILDFIKKSDEIKKLESNEQYRYCVRLIAAYQEFMINIDESIQKINERLEKLKIIRDEETSNFNFDQNINILKSEIKKDYVKWNNAYSIKLAYINCKQDNEILAYSHRISGWSNPVYELNENFSIQLRTNFGYGNSSYFYTKIQYKGIMITPFSEWVNYEFKKFSEISRYTRSYTSWEKKTYNRHKFLIPIIKNDSLSWDEDNGGRGVYFKPTIKNESWSDAMIFFKESCNVSIQNENEFVERYILKECEDMIDGLERIYNSSSISFFNTDNKKKYEVDKSGHILIEFRGEKISGALDFIDKIFELEGIIHIKKYIQKIEKINLKIKPYLNNEIILINNDLSFLNNKIKEIEPEYLLLKEKNERYKKEKEKISKELKQLNSKQSTSFSAYEADKRFLENHPEYVEFKKEYDDIKDIWEKLNQSVKILEDIKIKIQGYEMKITEYFKKK